MIRDGLRRDPVTSAVTIVVGLWMAWYGATLLTFPLTAARRRSFQGPTDLIGLRGWGVLFLIGAGAQLVRLIVLRWHRLAIWLNFIPTAVTVVWAVGWFAGPFSSGQPTYSFIAAIVLLHPWLRLLTERYYTVAWRG